MSTLIVDELFEDVVISQDITIFKSISVAFLRPWIYKQGTLVDGQLRLEIYDGATLLKQQDIDFSEINTNIVSPYAHGYIRFDVSPLALNVDLTENSHTYTFKLSMVNYTNDEDNYIAACREWDIRKYPIFGTEPVDDATEPFGFEIYVYKN